MDVDGEVQQFFDWHFNTIASRKQPNDADHTQNCVLYYTDGYWKGWHDKPCSAEFPAMCSINFRK